MSTIDDDILAGHDYASGRMSPMGKDLLTRLPYFVYDTPEIVNTLDALGREVTRFDEAVAALINNAFATEARSPTITAQAAANMITNPSGEGGTPTVQSISTSGTATVFNGIVTPSFETGLLSNWSLRPQNDQVITNLMTNPSGETGTTGWAANRITGFTTAAAAARSGAVGFKGLADGTAAFAGGIFNIATVTAGQRYLASAEIGATAASRLAKLSIQWIDNAAAIISTSVATIPLTAGQFARPTLAADAPTGAVSAKVICQVSTADQVALMPVGEAVYWDKVLWAFGQVGQTTIPDYFDGSMVGCAWTGAAHASTSTRSNSTHTDEVPAVAGTKVLRIQRDNDLAGPDQIYVRSATAARIACTPGQFIAARASFRAQSVPRNCSLSVWWYDSGGTQIGNATGVTVVSPNDAVGSWAEATIITGAAPALTASAELRLNVNLVAEGEVHYADAVVANVYATAPAKAPPYVDGDMVGFKWSGTAYASTTTQGTATAVDSTAWARYGQHCSRYTVVRNDGAVLAARTNTGLSGLPVTAGRWYAARISAHIQSIFNGTVLDDWKIRLYWYDAAGTNTSNSDGALFTKPVAGEVRDFFVIAQAPSDAAFVSVALLPNMPNPGDGAPVALVLDLDAFMLRDIGLDWTGSSGITTLASDVPAYIDGDQAGARWTGTPHASTTMLLPKAFDAVQWTEDGDQMKFHERLLGLPVAPVGQSGEQRRDTVLATYSAMATISTGSGWEDAMNRLLGANWSYEEFDEDGTPLGPYTIRITTPYQSSSDMRNRIISLSAKTLPAHLQLVIGSSTGFIVGTSLVGQEVL